MADDNWKHRSKKMRCSTCMWFAAKLLPDGVGIAALGRCRRHAPTINGYPPVFVSDWCGDHRLDEVTATPALSSRRSPEHDEMCKPFHEQCKMSSEWYKRFSFGSSEHRSPEPRSASYPHRIKFTDSGLVSPGGHPARAGVGSSASLDDEADAVVCPSEVSEDAQKVSDDAFVCPTDLVDVCDDGKIDSIPFKSGRAGNVCKARGPLDCVFCEKTTF